LALYHLLATTSAKNFPEEGIKLSLVVRDASCRSLSQPLSNSLTPTRHLTEILIPRTAPRRPNDKTSSPPTKNKKKLPTEFATYLSVHHPIQSAVEMAVQSKEALSPWGNALAGAMGAVFANTCVYPLDM